MHATNGADARLARIQLRPPDFTSDVSARAGEAPEHGLRGRRGERETLDRLVASVRAGNSRTLVVRGEAGPARPHCLNTCCSTPGDAA